MKRHAVIRHLEEHGCELFREGKKHTLYWKPSNKKTTSVPRHTEIVNELVRKICKDVDIPSPW